MILLWVLLQILICVGLDGALPLVTHTGILFLLYLAFRTEGVLPFVATFFYALLVAPYTGLAGIELVGPIVLLQVFVLVFRHALLAESYLGLASWVFFLSFAFLVLQRFWTLGFARNHIDLMVGFEAGVVALFLAFLSVPAFMVWDVFLDKLTAPEADNLIHSSDLVRRK